MSSAEEIIIRPIGGSEHIDPRNLWNFRQLYASMVWRDVRVKYDAMHLGFFWATARPLLMVVVIMIFRGGHTGEVAAGLPFPLFLYLGLVFWFYLADSVSEAAGAIQRDAGLVSKVFYPRLISPLVAVTANLVDLLAGLVPVVGFMLYFRIAPDWMLLWLPVVTLVIALLAFGGGLVFSLLILHFRDFERILGLLLYLGLFASPVFHMMEGLPEVYRPYALLNPASGVLMAVRACFAGDSGGFPYHAFGISIGAALLLLGLGIWAFKKMQERLLEML